MYSGMEGDSQLMWKDTLSPAGSLHVALMVSSSTHISVLATLSLFVLHKNQPVLDSPA